MSKFILETDLGRDPDDFFALCYLVSSGRVPDAIVLSPGDPDQVCLCRIVLDVLNIDIPIGVAKLGRDKSSVGSIHLDIINKYKKNRNYDHDGLGSRVIADLVGSEEATALVIGPVTSVAGALSIGVKITCVLMQGGFVPYSFHNHDVPRLDKFEEQNKVATFNLGGDKNAGLVLVNALNCYRYFVGKNICHCIEYNKSIHDYVLSFESKNRADELFREGMDLYLAKHDSKKFHDPSAAYALLYPEEVHFVLGRMGYAQGKWGAEEDGADLLAINIDMDKFWLSIANPSGYNKS